MKTPYDKLTKIYTKCLSHMTKMTATPIYGKIPLKSFSPETKASDLGTWYVALGVWGPITFVQMMILLLPYASKSDLFLKS